MVKARFGLGLLLLLPLYGCDTAEQPGAAAGASSGGTGNDSGAGGTSAGGTSAGGTSTGGTNRGEPSNRQASPNPPGGLSATDIPMFVTLGFDDNGYSGCPAPRAKAE